MTLLRTGTYAAVALFALTTYSSADLFRIREPIIRSSFGNSSVYHQAVCSHTVLPGLARCHAQVVTDARGNRIVVRMNSANPHAVIAALGTTDLRSAYNITATGATSTIVAIVDAYGYPNAEADLAVYRAKYGLRACTTANGCFIKINQVGGTTYPQYNASWAQEQALDLDMVSTMCPNCRIMLVQATSASFAALATAVNTAVARGAIAVSNSYGASESGSNAYASAYNHTGVAITASTGDSGYGAQFPATAPGAIAVGGTSLARNTATSRGWTETAWQLAGSGCSAVYAKPSWQTDKLCSRRMEADIAAVANPATGVYVYGPTGQGSASGWMVFGGTSVSAPLIAGIYGAVGATPNAAKKIWQSSTGLNDVVSGTNGNCGGTYFCTSGTGYDGPTGKGTPWGTSAF